LNPTDLGNGEFMIWGHDGGVMIADEVTDLPIDVDARLSRVWRVSEVDTLLSAADVGSVDIQFDLSMFTSVVASDLRLLIDTDNDGLFNDETSIAGATELGGMMFEFAGISLLTNTTRFTLGTINASQTPLPIELQSFNAFVNEQNQAELNWETASETNCDYYQINASTDGVSWDELSTVKGAGNSVITNKYHYIDPNTLISSRYYEVIQVDFDGTSSLVGRKYLSIHSDETGILFPNPTENSFEFQLKSIDYETTKLLSANGRVLDITWLKQEQDACAVDVSQFASGQYFMLVNGQRFGFVKR
jgi:hypothetical protein